MEKKKVKDYYSILGLEYSVTKEEIAARFQQIVESENINFNNKESLTEDQKEIKEAFDVLYDEYVRLDYDVAYRKIMRMGGFDKYNNSDEAELNSNQNKAKPDVRSLYPQMEDPNERLKRLHLEASDKSKKVKKNKLTDQGVMIEVDTSNLDVNYAKKNNPVKKVINFLVLVFVLIIVPVVFFSELKKEFTNLSNQVSAYFISEKDSLITEEDINQGEEKELKENVIEVDEKTVKKVVKKNHSTKSKTARKKKVKPKKKKLSTAILSKKAQEFLEKNEYDKAILYYEKLTKKKGKALEAYSNLGDIYYKLDKGYKAIESYNKALEINENFDQLYVKRAYSYLLIGKHENAVDDIKKAIDLNEFNVMYQVAACEIYIEYAKSEIENKDYKRALQNLKKSRFYSPKNADTYFYLGRIMLETAQYEEAIGMYSKALKLNPNHDEVNYYLALTYLNYGVYFRENNDLTNSLKYLKKVDSTDDSNRLSADKDISLTYIAAGKMQINKKEYKKAIDYLKKSLKYNIDNSEAYFLMGKAYYALDNYKESKKSLQIAIEHGSVKATEFYNDNKEDFVKEN